MCKGNIAAYGRRTLPHETCGRWHSNVLAVREYSIVMPDKSAPGEAAVSHFPLDAGCI